MFFWLTAVFFASILSAPACFADVQPQMPDTAAASQKAIEGKIAALKPGAPDFRFTRAQLLQQLASLYQAQANLAVAEALYRDALQYLRDSNNHYTADGVRCLKRLAVVLRAEGLALDASQVAKEQLSAADALTGAPPASGGDDYIQWLKNSFELGHPSAPALLGLAYLNGKGVAVDYRLAKDYFEKSVEQGDGCGEVNLALMYRKGLGVEKSESKAREYFKTANGYGLFYPTTGAANNGTAQYELGLAAQSGVGLNKEIGDAYQWYSLAASSICPQASDASLKLEAIKKTLTPEDKDQYDQQLANWKDQQRLALSP